MRTITLIIIHCSATPEGRSLSFEECRRDHIMHRHFRDIGYHFYITRDGTVHDGRPIEKVGAHCEGHNPHSIGICYEGGLDANGKPADTRTEAQRKALKSLVERMHRLFPKALIVGHHDLNPRKAYLCAFLTLFSVAERHGVVYHLLHLASVFGQRELLALCIVV